jgi:LuxR family transcriptional regulator, maltose regulon positive regulatory protein
MACEPCVVGCWRRGFSYPQLGPGWCRGRAYMSGWPPHPVRLITVVARAGWGKTTLLAAWTHELDQSRAVAWLAVDEADNEPVRFWTYVLSAIERVAPQLAEEALAVLRAPGLDPVLPALESLLNACVTTPAECLLVLVDYHLLSDPSIHTSMEFLLSYLPPESLQVIIASRADPPLPLARMRARGELAEIRLGDLRCTPTEGTALIAAVAGDANSRKAEELIQRTEGWPAALQLAALSVRGAPSPAAASTAARDTAWPARTCGSRAGLGSGSRRRADRLAPRRG